LSHFSVLVIGDDVAGQLQPFHEFECTGTDDEHVRDVDITAEVQARIDSGEPLQEALEYFGLEDRVCASEADVDRAGVHRYGYAIVEHARPDFAVERFKLLELDGATRDAAPLPAPRLVKAVDRTNPNKRWDWWQLGGRWQGVLMLKPGASGTCGETGVFGTAHENAGVDQARKGDVDFESMRAAAAARAGERWDAVHAIIAGRSWQTWDALREQHPDIDDARKAYRGQEVVIDVGRDKRFVFDGPDEFACTRDSYVERARLHALSTFAVVKDGQWYERGSMGWWCAVTDEKDHDEWSRQFAALLDELPDETLISVVDCHI
jgi:hypothetical protein